MNNKRYKYFIPAFIWIVIITVLSVIPSGSLSRFVILNDLHIDKIAHFVMYALLSFFVIAGTHYYSKGHGINFALYLYVFISVFFYGILMEIIQFVTFAGRNMEFLDIIANLIGNFIGLLIFYFLLLKRFFKAFK